MVEDVEGFPTKFELRAFTDSKRLKKVHVPIVHASGEERVAAHRGARRIAGALNKVHVAGVDTGPRVRIAIPGRAGRGHDGARGDRGVGIANVRTVRADGI